MWYTIIIVGLICCAYQPVPSSRETGNFVPERSEAGGIYFVLPHISHRALFLAQAEKADVSPKKDPGPEKKDGTPGDTRTQEEPSQQKDKKPPPKDFVPSEKIDADKAVDFPADI